MSDITTSDLAVTREVLAKQQAWFDTIGEASVLWRFDSLHEVLTWLSGLPKMPPPSADQERWLRDQRVRAEFGHATPDVSTHELVAIDAYGCECKCAERFKNRASWLEHLGDIAQASFGLEPKRTKRAYRKFTDRQVEIAVAAVQKRETKAA